MNKDDLLDALEDGREQFLDAIEGLSDEALLEPGVIEGWSIKDMLYHLSMWEAEMVKLLWQAAHGEKPSTLHFTQIDVDATNAAWLESSKGRPLERVLEDFWAVRKQASRRVEAFSDQDLEDPKRYAWLKERPLWEWIASDSFEHENEHAAQVRQWRAARGL
jgi:hypothetical protein